MERRKVHERENKLRKTSMVPAGTQQLSLLTGSWEHMPSVSTSFTCCSNFSSSVTKPVETHTWPTSQHQAYRLNLCVVLCLSGSDLSDSCCNISQKNRGEESKAPRCGSSFILLAESFVKYFKVKDNGMNKLKTCCLWSITVDFGFIWHSKHSWRREERSPW